MARQYEKAKEEITLLIDSLRSQMDFTFPTEQELMSQLGIGRNTIRRVVGELVEADILKRIQGKGTFIVSDHSKISFANWVSLESSTGQFLEQSFNGLKKSVPIQIDNIKIPYQIYFSELVRMFVQGKAPDVIQITPFWLQSLKGFDKFTSLEPLININNLKRRYSSEIAAGRINGSLCALNWALCPVVLYYNKVVLEQSGLDPDVPPKTIEEFEAMAVQVAKHNNTGMALPLKDGYNVFYNLPLFYSFGGGFIDSIGNVVIDTEANINTLNWMAKVNSLSGINTEKSIQDLRILFATNHLAFLFDGPYARGHFREISGDGKAFDEKYGVAKIPTGVSKTHDTVLLTHALAISKSCKNPELAAKLIEFLTTSEEHSSLYFENFGMLPCMRDLLHKDPYISSPFASVLIDQIEMADIIPSIHGLFIRCLPFMINVFSDVILRNKAADKKLSILREIVNTLSKPELIIL